MAKNRGHPANRASTLLTTVFRLSPLENHQVLPASGATRVIDSYSSAWLIPFDVNSPDSDYVLIDAGVNQRAREIERLLLARKVGLNSIKAVLLTHSHSDHVGGLHELSGNVTTYVSESDSKQLLGTALAEGKIPSLFDARRPRAAIPGIYPEIITDGRELTFGDLTIRAIQMSGHTKGSMAYLVRRGSDNAHDLLPGDAFDYRSDGSIVNAQRLFTANRYESEQSILDLARHLREERLVIDSVGPAHSGVGNIQAVHDFVPKLQ